MDTEISGNGARSARIEVCGSTGSTSSGGSLSDGPTRGPVRGPTRGADIRGADQERRLLEDGRNITAYDLLAAALGLKVGREGSPLADHLAECHGSLRKSVSHLLAGGVSIAGVGPARLHRLDAALRLGRCLALEDVASLPLMTSPDLCSAFLRQHFALCQREVFSCLFMDSRNRLLACRDMFFGTIDGAAVYPREVAAEALRLGANGVIAAHNHPSGNPDPSSSDHRITERLRDALALLDIRLLDHLIVGHGRVHSMARSGEAGF